MILQMFLPFQKGSELQMATTSFDKSFSIQDRESSKRFMKAVAQPRTVNVEDKDLKAESKKGLQLLARRFNLSQKS